MDWDKINLFETACQHAEEWQSQLEEDGIKPQPVQKFEIPTRNEIHIGPRGGRYRIASGRKISDVM